MENMKQYVIATTAAMSLALSLAAFAQSTPTSPAPKATQQQCKDLSGAALDACLKSAPGHSGDAASRAGGRTPGASESAASRSSAAPGQEKSGTEATGRSPSAGATGKGQSKSY
jgi:hypothetical protein